MYWITGLVGLVSIVAPFVLGYTGNTAALWTNLIIGAALVVTSVMEGIARDLDNREYWAAGLFGLVAIIAPFVFGFSNHANAMWTSVIVGIVAILAAGAKLITTSTS